MDNSNLLGDIPSTEGTVLAKNIGKPVAPPQLANRLVSYWAYLKNWSALEESPFSAVTLIAIFSMLLLGNVFRPILYLTLPPFLYLEISTIMMRWCPEFYWKLRRPFVKIELPEPVLGFQEAVTLVQNSPNPIERNSILLGNVAGTNWPVLVPINTFLRHKQVVGPTGMHKTWIVVMNIVTQQIMRKAFVNIITLGKEEKALVNYLAHLAKNAGLPFYFLTMNGRVPSMVLKPMKQSCFEGADEHVPMLLQTFGLNTGETTHGASYWQSQSAKLAKRLLQAFPEATTFRELGEAVEPFRTNELTARLNMSAREIEHGNHFLTEIANLADVPCLNANGPELDIMQVIKNPCVVVAVLPASKDRSTAAKIRRLLLYVTNEAAGKLEDNHPPIFFDMDEAQESLDPTELPIIKTSRDRNLGVGIIHQNMEDLDNLKMGSNVVGNCAVTVHLGALDPKTRKHLKETGGETKEAVITTYLNEEGGSTKDVDVLRLTSKVLEGVNSVSDLAVVSITNGGGFAQFTHPFVCKLLGFPTTHEEYLAFRIAPWPHVEGGVTKESFEEPPPAISAASPTKPKPKPDAGQKRIQRDADVLAALAALRDAPGVI